MTDKGCSVCVVREGCQKPSPREKDDRLQNVARCFKEVSRNREMCFPDERVEAKLPDASGAPA